MSDAKILLKCSLKVQEGAFRVHWWIKPLTLAVIVIAPLILETSPCKCSCTVQAKVRYVFGPVSSFTVTKHG